MRVRLRIALLFLTVLLALPAHADPLRVAAAANLQKVFTEALIPAFTEEDRRRR